jgi:signal transduction histidine kinase
MARIRKPIWPEVGWSFRLSAGLVAAVVLACTFNSLLWINRPFPGFFVWENLFVPAVGGPGWTGYEAQIPYQSRLVAIDGKPAHSAVDVYKAARRPPVGTGITYTFASPDEPSPISLTIPTMRLTWPDYLWTFGAYLLIGSLLTLVGFIVYIIRPDALAARAILITNIAWGIYLVTSADILGPAWFRPLCLILKAVAPMALLHVALTFPVERAILRQYPFLLTTLYALAIALGVAENLVFSGHFSAILFFNHLHAGAVTVSGLVLIGFLAHSLLFLPSATARQRTKIAALGAALAFLSPVAGYILFYGTGVAIPFNFLALPLALFPVAIGWAIVKHNLFEVDAIIRRAVAWAILTGLIALLYLGSVGFIEVLFARRAGRVAQLFFLLALVAAFNPLRNRLQATIDYFFARDRYDYPRTVGKASQALATLLDLETVVERILNTITQTIHVDFGAVWLRREGSGYFLHAATGDRRATLLPQQLDAKCPLVQRLAKRPQRLLTEEVLDGRDGHESRELARLGTRLLVPMSFERVVVGVIALGQKESGRFYSEEDQELLRTLASQGAVAVQNALSYRALMHANQELRAAQKRLIEAERLAAIGELSASVAHGIRNPLAGIKAAAQYAELDVPEDHPLHENIVDIITEVDKLEGRIKALLDFAKPFEPHPVPCQVGRIIDEALASLRSQIATQGIVLVTDVDAALPEAQVDYAQIEQVLLALLSNAVEAMPGGGQLRVSASLSGDGKNVRIEVADTGPGFAAEQIPALFTLFFTAKPSGTGLGLAVAKKIVELHSGKITAQSELTRGSRFTVELPLVPPIQTYGIASRASA